MAEKLSSQLVQINAAISVVNILGSVKNAVKYLSTEQTLDLIFMDIHLTDGTSFDIFRKINVNMPVIFTTTHDPYMVNAFEHHEIDYILKPIEKRAIEQHLKKYFQKQEAKPDWSDYITLLQWNSALQKVYKQRFWVQAGRKLLPIIANDISYFYADNKLTMVALKNGRHYIINYTLSELMSMLNPKHFYRINRKAIININAIQSIQMRPNYKWFLQINPQPDFEISIPTKKLNAFRSWVEQ